jgi:hypothetical protein
MQDGERTLRCVAKSGCGSNEDLSGSATAGGATFRPARCRPIEQKKKPASSKHRERNRALVASPPLAAARPWQKEVIARGTPAITNRTAARSSRTHTPAPHSPTPVNRRGAPSAPPQWLRVRAAASATERPIDREKKTFSARSKAITGMATQHMSAM